MSVARELVPEQCIAVPSRRRTRTVTSTTPYAPGLESALFAALFNQEHVGVGVCGPDGVLSMMSPALEEMLGEKYAPALQPSWPGRYHFHDQYGEPLAPGEDPLARALMGETVTGEVICVRRPDRDPRYLRCSAFQLRGASAGLLAAVVLAIDVTDWMAEQNRLDHLRDRLVDAVNHEVRTPLSVIAGHMELIKEHEAEVPDCLQWSLAAIARATGQLAEVVDRISDIAEESMAVAPPRTPRWVRLRRRPRSVH